MSMSRWHPLSERARSDAPARPCARAQEEPQNAPSGGGPRPTVTDAAIARLQETTEPKRALHGDAGDATVPSTLHAGMDRTLIGLPAPFPDPLSPEAISRRIKRYYRARGLNHVRTAWDVARFRETQRSRGMRSGAARREKREGLAQSLVPRVIVALHRARFSERDIARALGRTRSFVHRILEQGD
jgi:hypothetical protein